MEKEAVMCAVLVFVTASEVSGLDGFLRCDDKWISGFDVTMRCEVSKASIQTKCVAHHNVTFFKKDNVNQCAVLDKDYANCLPEGGQSEPTSSCWCEQNDTHFIHVHKFKADRSKAKGQWICQSVCFDSGGFNNPLIMSQDSSCNSSIEVSACEKNPCNPIWSCALDQERNKRRCMGPVGYTGEDCTSVFAHSPEAEGMSDCVMKGMTYNINDVRIKEYSIELDLLITLICVSTLLGVVMAGVGAGVYCARKQRPGGQQSVPPAHAPPANDPLADAPQGQDPRYNTPPAKDPCYNAPPDNAPQVDGSAGPSTGKTVKTMASSDESYEFSVTGSEAGESTEYNSSEVSLF